MSGRSPAAGATRGRRAGVRLVLALVLTLGGCAYFNALYNARELHEEAERAAERGQADAARRAYIESLDKAGRSFRSDPDGRWADDALLLIARNHFALGDCTAAGAALDRLTRESADEKLLSRAAVYRGAVEVCLGDAQAALPHLDDAVARAAPESPTAALARLWRARARFETGADSAGWADLAFAAAREDAIGREAQVERIARSAQEGRGRDAVAAYHSLLRDPQADLFADTLFAMLDTVAQRWGAAVAREALEPAPEAPWPVLVRDRFVLERARQAALAGDTATALEELDEIAGRSAQETGTRARLIMARLQLAAATSPAHLEEVRALLLPAVSDRAARPLIEGIGVVNVLLERARSGQPLAFFAAAEVARDRLAAYAFARQLFATYAELVGDSPWATKALLASLELNPPAAEAEAIRERIRQARDPYALAVRGEAPMGYEPAEERLGGAIGPLIEQATALVAQRDVRVRTVIEELDSVAAMARADSIAFECGTMVDSLGIGGIRRDSVQAACLRQDALLVDSFLAVDTTLLRDTTTADADGPSPADEERRVPEPEDPTE